MQFNDNTKLFKVNTAHAVTCLALAQLARRQM